MRRTILLIAIAGMISACTQKSKTTVSMNPFLAPYQTPFDVPPFDRIKNTDYLPAFTEGMKQHDQEILAIARNPESATFANTIEALDRSGDLLNRVRLTFFNVKEAHTNDSLNQIAKEVAPLLSQHHDAILMNETLFNRVKSVYNQKDNLELTPEQNRLVSEIFKQFVRGGANLPADQKEELKKINEELSLLDIKFDKNLLAETNGFKLVIEEKADLSGLPESVVAAASADAKNAGMEDKWIFTLQKPSWIPFLTYSDRRELREKLYKAMYNRCNSGNENDNKAVINQYINLRIRKANLMGFPDWASFVLDQNMAKKPENVYDLLTRVWNPAIIRAKEEAADMQEMIYREGGKFLLESWDWWYYSEKVRKEKFDLDDNQLRPYFKLENVLQGAFHVAGRLFGLTFRQLDNMPVYHPDCRTFEVKDADGSLIGIMYTDFYARSSKKGGAWMNNYREQAKNKDGMDVRPVVAIHGNFPKPVGDNPSLLSFDDVETLFHEFGHALHGLLSKCTYIAVSGTNVSRDFVELPSQIMEHWASEPEVMKVYARHFRTDEVIPQVLIDKITKAGTFNQGFVTTEFIAAAILDMDYHTLKKSVDLDISAFEKQSMDKIGLISSIIPRYRSTYFAHAFSWGYSAGYYAYNWAEVLDADAFEAFKETGDIFNPAVARSFRTNILEKGNTDEPMKLYLNFRGKEPGIEPLLRNRGLM